jgi:hypothetical protein
VKTIIVLLTMLLPAVAWGQMVKCVAKDGKVTYAATCPPDMTEHKVGVKGSTAGPAPSAGGTQPQSSLAERDAAFKKRMIERQESEQKDAKAQAVEQQKKEVCASARAYLKSVEEGQRIARTDPKTGERVFLDDKEREAELVRARATAADRCKS